MVNDKSTITKELDHLRNSINEKNETQSDDDFILLDKIVSKGKKYDQKTKIGKKPNNKDTKEKNNVQNNETNAIVTDPLLVKGREDWAKF